MGIVPSPFYSFPLLSQLPSISFDVCCWDFKGTLSTWAGVAFSEQARVPRSSVAGREVGPTPCFPMPFPRQPRAVLLGAGVRNGVPYLIGWWVHAGTFSSYFLKRVVERICLPSKLLKRRCLTGLY